MLPETFPPCGPLYRSGVLDKHLHQPADINIVPDHSSLYLLSPAHLMSAIDK